MFLAISNVGLDLTSRLGQLTEQHRHKLVSGAIPFRITCDPVIYHHAIELRFIE